MHAGNESCAWAGVIVVDRRFTRTIAVADLFPQYETRESRCSRNEAESPVREPRIQIRQTEVALNWPVIRRCGEATGQSSTAFSGVPDLGRSSSNLQTAKEPEIISFILWSRGMTF